MSAPPAGAAPQTPLWGELRYSAELATLLVDGALMGRPRRSDAQPVLLIPGFMASDASLAVMRTWLRRRGHTVALSGLRANVGCAGQIVARLQDRVRQLAAEGGPVAVIGQSRGGALARALAVREPDRVGALVMLGSPVRDPLAVAPAVLRTVAWVARLGDLRVPGVLSSRCGDGDCCAAFRAQMSEPLDPRIDVVAVHSRSDAIVDWRACIEPGAEQLEVDSSHCGMSVHPEVFRAIDRVLDRGRRQAAAA
jgi:pimeloyl-ACP methyl ester carboxylesterase